MRWLVTGAAGMLGQDLVEVLGGEGPDVRAVDREEVDITDPGAVATAVADRDVVVNCAAWTAVDAAEEREGDAFTVNAVGPATLARAIAGAGGRLVQISTDYVFDGNAEHPYAPDAPQRPRSAYGRTKAAGEWAVAASGVDHLVVRTAWLYGARGPCFPRTVQRVLTERGGIDVVQDQVGQPTWTRDLAAYVVRLVEAGAPTGSYHGTSQGQTSWFGFAGAVAASMGLAADVVRPTTSEAFVRPAPRPAYSVLAHDERAGVAPIGDWADRWRAAADEVLGLDAAVRPGA
ncbi:dTDP-4-dehydrorhamnose reductase [Cellulomonas wangsupingiae]|uniref:dTDP-4-dehydrorhamnose reductase n=1 Tax=Cellulomonas wangsupingiae TaxID=2968085 RepID=UPI001D0F36BD|nr:dTDP-4-dehydrorhamnose reductase [Cellulomonas wangsupingiae]